jgi:hypothetical protein
VALADERGFEFRKADLPGKFVKEYSPESGKVGEGEKHRFAAIGLSGLRACVRDIENIWRFGRRNYVAIRFPHFLVAFILSPSLYYIYSAQHRCPMRAGEQLI